MERGRRPAASNQTGTSANEVQLLGRLECAVAAVSDPHGPDVAYLTLMVGPDQERFPVWAFDDLAHRAAQLAAEDLVAVRGALRRLPATHVEASSIEVRNGSTAPRRRASPLAVS